MASNEEDLDVTSQEVEQFTVAFQDPYFRDLFFKYAEELNDPENRSRFEHDIRMMEQERGMAVKFIHPEPGHVLQTTIDGRQPCFLNVCSSDVVRQPYFRPGTDRKGHPGQHWSLPCNLTVPRRDRTPGCGLEIIYDVIFHPETLLLASRIDGFQYLVDLTAVCTVAKHCGVKLDTKNFQVLSEKYKGFPQVSIVRRPLSLSSPKAQKPSRTRKTACPQPAQPFRRGRPPALEPQIPQYTIRHRSYVDLQDYRYCRDSAPSPIPKELVITVDLPLLCCGDDASLKYTGKEMILEAKPDYKLQLTLPYVVDEDRGTAQFNKIKNQLVITLPVVQKNPPKMLPAPCCKESDWPSRTIENTSSLPHNHPMCPIFTSSQDATSMTFIINVEDIAEHSVSSEVSSYQCEIRFCVKTTGTPYVLYVSFLPQYCLNTNDIFVSVSGLNLVVTLTKSSECFGPWKNLFFRLNGNPVQERKFIYEENVDEFLEDGLPPPKIPWSTTADEIYNMDLAEKRAFLQQHKTDLEEDVLIDGERSSGVSGVTKLESSRSDDTDQSDAIDTVEEKPQSPEPAKDCPAQLQGAGHPSKEDEGLCAPARELDEDDLPDGAELVQNPTPSPSSTEQAPKDVACSDISAPVHKTQCAFKFDNALLFDLD